MKLNTGLYNYWPKKILLISFFCQHIRRNLGYWNNNTFKKHLILLT